MYGTGCQTTFGTSPGQKLREKRLNHANSLLAETDMSVMDIAVAAGFSSANAFRIAHRKAFGAAPSSRFKMKYPEDRS